MAFSTEFCGERFGFRLKKMTWEGLRRFDRGSPCNGSQNVYFGRLGCCGEIWGNPQTGEWGMAEEG